MERNGIRLVKAKLLFYHAAFLQLIVDLLSYSTERMRRVHFFIVMVNTYKSNH